MTELDEKVDRLDRHALAIAIWLAAGFAALVLFRVGFGTGGLAWLAGGYAALLAGFAGHVIVNRVTGTGFSAGEVALALVLMLAAVLATVLATLLQPGFAGRFFLPLVAGFAVLAGAAVFYLVTRHGPRRAFEIFDVTRDNNARPASRLPHRGGRK